MRLLGPRVPWASLTCHSPTGAVLGAPGDQEVALSLSEAGMGSGGPI